MLIEKLVAIRIKTAYQVVYLTRCIKNVHWGFKSVLNVQCFESSPHQG